MIGILLGAALLIPPTEPPPPPDRLAAAAELRRLAPFSEQFRDSMLDQAMLRAASQALRQPGAEARYAELLLEAKDRITVRLAGTRTEIEARAGYCLDERIGRRFELAALQDMAQIVPTKGGYVLWEHAMLETAQGCYEESVGHMLIGFDSSLTWVAAKELLARLPRHDPSRGIPPSLAGELETLCGKRARGAVQVRDGRLGIVSRRVDGNARRRGAPTDTYFCLLHAAKVSGFQAVIFER